MKRVLLVLTVAVALAGCSGSDPESAPTALPSLAPAAATPSASPSPSAVPVVTRPPEADKATAAGAEAFARYWIAELNAAFVSLDASRLQKISGPNCATCQSYIDSLRLSAANLESYQGGQIEVRELAATSPAASATTVILSYDSAEGRVLNAEGLLIDRVAARQNVTLQFDLLRRGSGWIVQQLVRV